MLQRENKIEEPTAVFIENELNIIDKLVRLKRHETSQPRSLSNISGKWPNLGVTWHERATHHREIIWRSFSRLNDIHLGMLLAKGNVVN